MRGLDQGQIVEAALELLDREGLAGVTTRKVAGKLGVKSSSLYWHVRDRETLLDLLSDRIVSDARWPKPRTGWRETVRALMREYLRCLLAHRDGARVTAGRPPTGPMRTRGAELLVASLRGAGLSSAEAMHAGLLLTTYVVGFALEHQAAEARRALDNPKGEKLGTSHFDRALELVLEGIQSRTRRAGRAKSFRPRPKRTGERG